MLRRWWIYPTLAVLPHLEAAAAWAQPAEAEIGRVSAVNPAAASRRGAGAERVMFIGNDVRQNERIVTNTGGQAHLLFLDQSALTVGPNSDVVLDRFVYDPARDTGTIAVRVTRGALRFIGGRISKEGEVSIGTPAGTLGIRGGIAVFQLFDDGSLLVAHIFGQTGIRLPDGRTLAISRRGFGIHIPFDASPRQIPSEQLSGLLSQFRGSFAQVNPAAGGGAARPSLDIDWSAVNFSGFDALLGLPSPNSTIQIQTSAGPAASPPAPTSPPVAGPPSLSPPPPPLSSSPPPPPALPPRPPPPPVMSPPPPPPMSPPPPHAHPRPPPPPPYSHPRPPPPPPYVHPRPPPPPHHGHAYGHLHGVPSGPPGGPPRGPPCGGPCR